jgi:hypothetical protein
MKLKLSDDIISPSDVKSVIEQLNDYAKQLRSVSIKKRVTDKHVPIDTKLAPAASFVLDNFLNGQAPTADDVEHLVIQLNDYLKNSLQLRLILADIPPLKLKRDIVHWCRNHLGNEVLIDFRFSPTLLGGMVVVSGSHIYDWSWRRMILENKSKFAEAMRSV